MNSHMDLWSDKYGELQSALEKAVCERTGDKETYVTYSAYDSDGDDLPLNNLNEVAFEGTFVVVAEYDSFWDASGWGEDESDSLGKEFRSEPVTNPTWLDLAVLAHESVKVTKDFHHRFFEGAGLSKDEPGCLKLYFGS